MSQIPHLVFGAGGIGVTEKSFTYTWADPEPVKSLLSVLQKLNVIELDSAASYPPGNPWNTETLLGQAEAVQGGFIIDSKVLVRRGEQSLHDEGIESSIDKTLDLLGSKKVRTLYAHAPDQNTTLEVTAAAFDKQYKAGKFERVSIDIG
jgi:aflatoxin B1 aldehyde reductase